MRDRVFRHAALAFGALEVVLSLPLFHDDLPARQLTTARFLEAQARRGLGARGAAQRLLRSVLERDPSHALAADLIGESKS